MNDSEYKKMSRFEEFYWWHRGKVHLLNSLMSVYFKEKKGKIRILEVGCGTGENLNVLKDWGDVSGFDISQEAVNICKGRGFGNVYLEDIGKMNATAHAEQYDLIVALDVLEHIQDDVFAMKQVQSMLKPGGLFFVNVPAHKFLWSEHDEALQHKRRYNSVELKQKLTDVPFKVIKFSYFISTLFLPIALFRMYNSFFGRNAYPSTSYVILPSWLNTFLTNILRVEANFLKIHNLRVGTTLIAVAQK